MKIDPADYRLVCVAKSCACWDEQSHHYTDTACDCHPTPHMRCFLCGAAMHLIRADGQAMVHNPMEDLQC